MDSRIGTSYNNPSLRYNGYCLLKDTKQFLVNYADVPENLIEVIEELNCAYKDFIVDRVLEFDGAYSTNDKWNAGRKRKLFFCVYYLSMKSKSDDFWHSSIPCVMKCIKSKGAIVVVYVPALENKKRFF